jgi:deoxyribose-phosphate aldolase
MKYSYSDLAKMIDHSLLHPTMTDADLKAGCELAAKYQVASVCIKPYAVKQAVEWLRGSGVLVGCVIGFPMATAPPNPSATRPNWPAKTGRTRSTW